MAQQQRVGDSPSRKKTEVVLPHYLHEDTIINKERWRQDFVFVREPSKPKGKEKASQPYKVKGVTSAHVVAANGNLQLLMEVEKQNPESLFSADSNGWCVRRGGATRSLTHGLTQAFLSCVNVPGSRCTRQPAPAGPILSST
jgi:hypothetical protein